MRLSKSGHDTLRFLLANHADLVYSKVDGYPAQYQIVVVGDDGRVTRKRVAETTVRNMVGSGHIVPHPAVERTLDAERRIFVVTKRGRAGARLAWSKALRRNQLDLFERVEA